MFYWDTLVSVAKVPIRIQTADLEEYSLKLSDFTFSVFRPVKG